VALPSSYKVPQKGDKTHCPPSLLQFDQKHMKHQRFDVKTKL